MPEIIDAPVAEVIEQPAAPAAPRPTRFEIPSFTEPAKPAVAEPAPKAPDATPPVATEENKPPEAPKPPIDPEAEQQAKARAERLRVNRLYKQNAELKANYDLAQKELEKLRTPAAPSVAAGAPDPTKFTDIAEYTKAVTDWAKAENSKELTAKQQHEQFTRREKEITESWETSADKGAGKYEDFEQVVGDMKPDTAWKIAIMQCENADDVAYYLGKNMTEARRIIGLEPLAQIREIGKLEAKLLATPPTPKLASKAPAPINPVAGVATPVATIESGMDFEKFRNLRNRQLGRK